MNHNVCIYFSDTGGGHRSAAEALEAGIRTLVDESVEKPEITIIKDSIAEKTHPINRRFVELYNYLLRHHQPLMKYYYWFLHLVRPESGFNYALSAKYLKMLLQRDKPSVVVSAHPMISHVLAHAMKQIGIKDRVKLVVVVTDPNADLWKAWACPDADMIVAPNDLAKERLVAWGVAEDKVQTLGMPVHPDFLRAPSIGRRAFLNHLGLSPDLLTICINAGWAGGGNMLKIYQALSKVKRPIQAIFLCGHNQLLYEKAMELAAESDVPTAVLPFHDCMPDLMSAVDMMITKAGGLTTYQAVARRLPLAFDVLTEPMPQEKGTISMLVEQKVASAIHEPEDIIAIVDSLEVVAERATHPLPTNHQLNLTDSGVYEMSKRILEMIIPPVVITPAEPTEQQDISAVSMMSAAQPMSVEN